MADTEKQTEDTEKTEASGEAQAPSASGLEHGTYEIIRSRLNAAGKDLRERLDKLNGARKEVFGSIETTLLATERITTDNNCSPRDMVPVGNRFLFGYNVHIGLKSVTSPKDIFAVYTYEDRTFRPSENSLIDDADFRRDFAEL
ncbi:MAG: DNA repair ATPase, partial [Thermoplasmata archaeon]|nr:DNA repair ATPase [Thermoplasmata archaeon]